jgi:hypothetical protein
MISSVGDDRENQGWRRVWEGERGRKKVACGAGKKNSMPIDIAKLIRMSPCLYHVTYSSSLDRIKRLRRLECAARLMIAGGRQDLLRKRREKMEEFSVDGDMIRLTDQQPIVEANILFQDGWTLPDLIEAINRRVFFWRGRPSGLLKKDQGHFGKYNAAGLSLVFLRLSINGTIHVNVARGPELCMYNSGAARMNNGQKIPRRPSTFVGPERAGFHRKMVKEVVFREFVELPSSTEFCEGSWEGPWTMLWQGGVSEGRIAERHRQHGRQLV